MNAMPLRRTSSSLSESSLERNGSLTSLPTKIHSTRTENALLQFGSLRSKAGSITRRRKISVPELVPTMSSLREGGSISPKAGRRPPMIKMRSQDSFSHERSNSAPGTSWRSGPFGGAMVSGITGPAVAPPFPTAPIIRREPSPCTSSTSYKPAEPRQDRFLFPHTFTATPLSPILSPTVPKPDLKVDTRRATKEEDDVPPEVPRKDSYRANSQSPKLFPSIKPGRRSPTKVMGAGMHSAASTGCSSPPTPSWASSTNHSRTTSESTAVSNGTYSRTPGHARTDSASSVMERGRPIRRGAKATLPKSEPSSPEMENLPHGHLPDEAATKLPSAERHNIEKQAYDQAEKFEVLRTRDVNSLSRELRSLDERCEYLRSTYKSLRASRQKLHTRMMTYLKRTETVIFSRESLLKQEETLEELDRSIDDWILKLEQAENRRLRVRQKLLEHVAAAVIMKPATTSPHGSIVAAAAESTPPRSPVKTPMQSPPTRTLGPQSPQSINIELLDDDEDYDNEALDSPMRAERRAVESIKIYADNQVLNLYDDIEMAIGRMCEQVC